MTHSTSEYDKEIPYVVNDKGCWIFAGEARDQHGYAIIKHRGKAYRAHRYNYLKYVGEIPEGMVVRHQCKKQRDCINPRHLLIGTQQDNIDDRERDKKIWCKNGHELNHINSYRFNNRTVCRICKATSRINRETGEEY